MSVNKIINIYNVRKATVKDYKLIAEYWHNQDFLSAFNQGIDIDKIPEMEVIINLLINQEALAREQKNTFVLMWELSGNPIGYTNITPIIYGNTANVHFHIWDNSLLKRGYGKEFLQRSLPIFFENFELKSLGAEVYQLNKAPQNLLIKLGFKLIDEYATTPGDWSFYQNINKYILTKEELIQ